jgi:hypothetical protein
MRAHVGERHRRPAVALASWSGAIFSRRAPAAHDHARILAECRRLIEAAGGSFGIRRTSRASKGRSCSGSRRRIAILETKHARGVRILDLEPDLARARAIRVLAVLRDDAFEAELARVLENDLTVALEVLVVLDAGRRLREQLFEPRLARMQPLRPKILAIEFEQIEGIEEGLAVMSAAVEPFKDRHARVIATNGLAVDRHGCRPQRRTMRIGTRTGTSYSIK